MDCIKTVKDLCLVLFIGMLPFTSALADDVRCKYIWTVECQNCEAPVFMECHITETCQKFADGTEKCLAAQTVKGHIKNNTVMDIFIWFYVIEDNIKPKKPGWVETVELTATYSEKHLIESLSDTVFAQTPDTRIVDWEITYFLDVKAIPLYKDIDAKSPIILDWQEREAVGQLLEDEFRPDASGNIFRVIEPEEYLDDSTEIDSKPLTKAEEIEWVRKFLTGNEDTLCWATSTPNVVSFTGSDEKICMIESKCINLYDKQDKISDDELFVCAFDKERRKCPSATGCLKDPTVRRH